MFTTYLYMRIGINRIQIKNIGNGESVDLFAEASFSRQRMLIGNFTEAQALIKKAVSLAKGSGLKLSLRILIHPTELVTGGLTQIEERVLYELAHGSGAGKAFIWLGLDLSDEEVKAKLS